MTAANGTPKGLGCRLGVVVLNYRHADDTIECLESLLRSTIPVAVAVVDNASGDGSMDTIAGWARGEVAATPASPAMASFMSPPLPKPIALDVRDAATAKVQAPHSRLTLIDSGRNGGFAAGNNVGILQLLLDPDIEFIWLLNNDTVVAPDAAAALLAQLDATPRLGMCGTMVQYYWRPNVVQALNGARFSIWTGYGRPIGNGQSATKSIDGEEVAEATDYVLGASLAVSRKFLQRVGLMHEGYFLYFEEIDWATRNQRLEKPMATGFARGARVFHKEGGSIGSSVRKGERSTFADYWLNRSRLTFTGRFYPWLLPWHIGFTLLLAVQRLLWRQPGKALALGKAMLRLPL